VLLGGFDSLGRDHRRGLIASRDDGGSSTSWGRLAQTTALVVIVIILLFRPTGLFGSRKVQRGEGATRMKVQRAAVQRV
jgi:branched-chain amino acid transport system permease protein